MPLKESHGNMYDWVSHVHTHLGGECSHRCSYCYVGKTFQGRSPKYTGPPRLLENELSVDYGKGRTIFVEHMNDLFAQDIPDNWITRILFHCKRYPDNQYIFQTKNPKRATSCLSIFPPNFLFGTTIETNRPLDYLSKAPSPAERYLAIGNLKQFYRFKIFVTIEPIMDFDLAILGGWIQLLKPEFINIGADSKNSFLKEPPKQKIIDLINQIKSAGIEIRKKINLKRLGI